MQRSGLQRMRRTVDTFGYLPQYQPTKQRCSPHPYICGEGYIRHFGTTTRARTYNPYNQHIRMSQKQHQQHQQQVYQQQLQQLQQLQQQQQLYQNQHHQNNSYRQQQMYQQHRQQVEQQQQQQNDLHNPQLSVNSKVFAQPPLTPVSSAARPPPPLTEATGTAPIQTSTEKAKPEEKRDSKYTDFDWSPFDSPLVQQCESQGFNPPATSLLENVAHIPMYSPTTSAIQSACNSRPHSPRMVAAQPVCLQPAAAQQVQVMDVESGEYLEPLSRYARAPNASYPSQMYYR